MSRFVPTIQSRLVGLDIAAILLAAITACALALSWILVAGQPGQIVDETSIVLGFVHLALLTVAILTARRESAAVVYLFVFASLVIYDQSLIYSYFVPNNGLYARKVVLTTADVRFAMVYLNVITLAAVAGMKLAELTTTFRGTTATEAWLRTYQQRRVFYAMAVTVFLIYLVLAFVLVPINGKIWSDQIIYLLPLHFIIYNGYIYVIVALLLLPGATSGRGDRLWIGGVLLIYTLSQFIMGEKGAFMHVVLMAFVTTWLLRRYIISMRVLTLAVAAAVSFLFMFPLNSAIKFALRHPEIDLAESMAVFVETFSEGFSGGLLGQFESLSLRLGGVEWFCTVVVFAEGFKDYFTVTNLAQSLLNTFVPWPGKLFPELVDVGRAMQVVVWGLGFEDTDAIGGYPTAAGWLYVTFGWWSALLMFAWGAISMMVVRSSLSMLNKLMFLYLFVWSFFLSGDFVPYAKAYVSFLICLWITKRVVLALTAPARHSNPRFVPAKA